MPIWRLQCSIQADSAFPRDAVVMTPHFNDQGVGTDPQGLCDDLADALSAWVRPANGRQLTVKAYDAQGTVPVLPQGEATRNTGLIPGSYFPRELAVCLSYYSERNAPRYRGRLYVPLLAMPAGPETPGVRPNEAFRAPVAALAPIFAGLGGADVDWVVYSRVGNVARPVTNWWVDDEWDVVRSRGLRPTTRTSGTLSE